MIVYIEVGLFVTLVVFAALRDLGANSRAEQAVARGTADLRAKITELQADLTELDRKLVADRTDYDNRYVRRT